MNEQKEVIRPADHQNRYDISKKKTLETLLFQGFHACGSNRIRTYDLPGMNRTLWPAELLSQMVAGAGLEPATSGL